MFGGRRQDHERAQRRLEYAGLQGSVILPAHTWEPAAWPAGGIIGLPVTDGMPSHWAVSAVRTFERALTALGGKSALKTTVDGVTVVVSTTERKKRGFMDFVVSDDASSSFEPDIPWKSKHYVYGVFDLPGRAPYTTITVKSGHASDPFGAYLRFAHEDFDDVFGVSTVDERFARWFLNVDIMHWLLGHQDLARLQLSDARAAALFAPRNDEGSFEDGMLGFVLGLVARFPE